MRDCLDIITIYKGNGNKILNFRVEPVNKLPECIYKIWNVILDFNKKSKNATQNYWLEPEQTLEKH